MTSARSSERRGCRPRGGGVLHHGGEGMLVEQIGGDDVDAVEEMADALVGVVGGAPYDAHHLVALGEQQLREVRAVLPGDADDQSGPAGLPDPAGGFRFGRPALTGRTAL